MRLFLREISYDMSLDVQGFPRFSLSLFFVFYKFFLFLHLREDFHIVSCLHFLDFFISFCHNFSMGFRISNIHEYDRFVAIDLGSYRVRAALYSLHEGKLELEGSASIRQHRKNMHQGTIMDMQ
jgi:hypothetical protein